MSDHVEIPKGELDTLRRAYGLLDKLWNDPKQALAFKKIAKEVEPTLKVPDLDLVSQVTAANDERYSALTEQNKALTERLDKWQAESREKDELSKLGSTFDKVRADYKLTDEGVEKVVGLMRDRQISDPEAAAALWERSQPKAAKPISAPNYLPASMDIMGNLDTEAHVKEWLADPLKKFDNVVAEILSENAA